MAKLNYEQFSSLQNKLRLFNFTPEELLELLKIIGDPQEFLEKSPDEISLSKRKSLVAKILEYMILNQKLLLQSKHLLEILNLILGKLNADKEQELEEELEEEKELSEDEKKRRFQLVLYEIHKALNPRQLAGETSLENFINNVAVRGVRVAQQYPGHEHAAKFTAHDLTTLASYKHNLVALIGETGTKGFGRGL